MRNKAKDNRPQGLRPVKRIEVSEKNLTLRFVLFIVFLIIAVVAIAYGLISLLTTEPGWAEIEVDSSELNCGEDFIFTYYLGGGDRSAGDEKKLIRSLYSTAAVKTYRLFDTYEEYDGMNNICHINRNPNKVIEVDSILYKAFETLESYNSRYLYLGALNSEYSTIFFRYNDAASTMDYDPYNNEETAEYFAKLAEFASSEEDIKLELLGNNQVRLNVSEEYIAYAAENEISWFIDFYRAKNAFIIDYFAEIMIASGFRAGCISSYDGYVRNLDNSGTDYSLNIFDRQDHVIYTAATMKYDTARSMVTIRNYPLGDKDSYYFYTSVEGEIISPYVDISDGLYRSSEDTLTVYSEGKGCAELFLQVQPIYVCDKLDTDDLVALAKDGIYSVWSDENVIFHTEESLNLSEFYSDKSLSYTKEYVND